MGYKYKAWLRKDCCEFLILKPITAVDICIHTQNLQLYSSIFFFVICGLEITSIISFPVGLLLLCSSVALLKIIIVVFLCQFGTFQVTSVPTLVIVISLPQNWTSAQPDSDAKWRCCVVFMTLFVTLQKVIKPRTDFCNIWKCALIFQWMARIHPLTGRNCPAVLYYSFFSLWRRMCSRIWIPQILSAVTRKSKWVLHLLLFINCD